MDIIEIKFLRFCKIVQECRLKIDFLKSMKNLEDYSYKTESQ